MPPATVKEKIQGTGENGGELLETQEPNAPLLFGVFYWYRVCACVCVCVSTWALLLFTSSFFTGCNGSQVWPHHLFMNTHTHTEAEFLQPLSTKMYYLRYYSVAFFFFFAFLYQHAQYMSLYVQSWQIHSNLLKRPVDLLLLCLFICASLMTRDMYDRPLITYSWSRVLRSIP